MIQRLLNRGAFVIDVFSDVLVMASFLASGNPYWAMFVLYTIISPYVVCWASGMHVANDMHLAWYLNLIYMFPPTGILILVILDIYLVLEAFILNPIYYLCGYYIRDLSRVEYGYLRLRMISELFLENVPQVLYNNKQTNKTEKAQTEDKSLQT